MQSMALLRFRFETEFDPVRDGLLFSMSMDGLYKVGRLGFRAGNDWESYFPDWTESTGGVEWAADGAEARPFIESQSRMNPGAAVPSFERPEVVLDLNALDLPAVYDLSPDGAFGYATALAFASACDVSGAMSAPLGQAIVPPSMKNCAK